MSSPPTSPTSPTSRAKRVVPHGFLAAPKAKIKSVSQMTVRELHDSYHRNKQFLASPGASTSTYIAKILHEQNAIEIQLAELEGVDNINTSMRNTRIMDESDMDVDTAPEPPVSRTIETKRRVLARAYGPLPGTTHVQVATMSMEEALEIEQRANAVDMQRRQRQEEKQARLHDITYGHMSKSEREARIWAFMNHKPTDSDMEDDSDDGDSDEDDPASWFDDDQDDGRKDQPIVEPDEPDYYDLIRVDSSRFHYNTFYEPRDDEH